MAQLAERKRNRAGGRPTPVMSLAGDEPPVDRGDRIARKAYELWETRGRRDGYALDDWLDAEAIVMEQIHEARE